jgi:hypothetical protein
LIERRPIIRNLSLAARVKIGLLAELLQESSHSVEILSQGEVVERQFKFYPRIHEPPNCQTKIPVYYSSALPIRFLNGVSSSQSLLRVFKERHRWKPFDIVIIYNLKPPQVTCARYAIRKLNLPVILEYEDDAFQGVWGNSGTKLTSKYYTRTALRLLGEVSGCMGVSPYLLSQTRGQIPKLLLRGIVSHAIVALQECTSSEREKWVVFSGTHEGSQGLEQLIRAWRLLRMSDWQLHIAGEGPITPTLRNLAAGDRSVIFHGFLNREQNANLLCKGLIGMNPQDPPKAPGTVFAFKIIEYLASRLHVITTPRGPIEPELESGISYIENNSPEAIAAGLRRAIESRAYERTAEDATLRSYGPNAVCASLNRLLHQVAVHG